MPIIFLKQDFGIGCPIVSLFAFKNDSIFDPILFKYINMGQIFREIYFTALRNSCLSMSKLYLFLSVLTYRSKKIQYKKL